MFAPRRVAYLALCASLLAPAALSAPAARADEAKPLDAPLNDLDPLELARRARAVGDDPILAALADQEAPLSTRLRAVRASRFLHAPELALGPLAELAASRDATLAPAAAIAAYRIAQALSASELDARESDRAPLVEARDALLGLERDESARPDLRRAAAFAAEALEPLLIAPAE